MKRKINLNRPQVSSDEIAKRKDFDSVLNNNAVAGKPFFKKPWFLSAMAVATVGIVATLFMIKSDPQLKELSANSSADSLALENFYRSEEAKPCVAPPIAGLNIESTTYRINAEKGGTIEHKTGSKLVVPKNAFVSSKGDLVKGEIELRYREFHDVVDCFVAGIPMTYDSAGQRYHFETAGMMEILAFQNGEQVQMAEGKTINVELASNDASTKYNLYKLDTLHNNWSCLGKDKVIKSGPANENVDSPSITTQPEFIAVEKKKEEIQKKIEQEIAALPPLKVAEPKKPAKVTTDKYIYMFEFEMKEFPELASYKNVSWVVGAENEGFNDAKFNDINATEWEDVKIKEGTKKGENYRLDLKRGSKKINNLVVYPKFEGKNYTAALKEYEDKFKKYETVLAQRKAEEEKIEAAYREKLAALKAEQEKIMREWTRKQDEQFRASGVEQQVRRVFAVSSFGVFNCDNPMAYPQGQPSVATLKKEKGKEIKCYDVFLAEKGKNVLYTYTKNPVTRFTFNHEADNILWTVEDGVLFWLQPSEFASLGTGRMDISMNRVEQKFNNVDELKTFFGL
jgi:hypothetical protein